jgi:hypothetical protein
MNLQMQCRCDAEQNSLVQFTIVYFQINKNLQKKLHSYHSVFYQYCKNHNSGNNYDSNAHQRGNNWMNGDSSVMLSRQL